MLFKRKKKTDDTQLHIESIPDESTKGFNVVEICEQMVDAARELDVNRILNKIVELDMEVQSDD